MRKFLLYVCGLCAMYNAYAVERGWAPATADSAHNISQWKRWWKYVFAKEKIYSIVTLRSGLQVEIYPRNEIYKALYVRKSYHPNLLYILNSLIPSDGVFIDVGAGFGLIALSVAQNSNRKVYAIEPSARDYQRLLKNQALNGLHHVVCSQVAIATQDAEQKLLIATDDRSYGNTTLSKFRSKEFVLSHAENVPGLRMSSYVHQHGIRRIDAIHLDLDDVDCSVLSSMEGVVRQYHPVLAINLYVMDFYSKKYFEAVRDVITSWGYVMYRLVQDGDFSLQPINSYSELDGHYLICVPEGREMPKMPVVEEASMLQKVKTFFSCEGE